MKRAADTYGWTSETGSNRIRPDQSGLRWRRDVKSLFAVGLAGWRPGGREPGRPGLIHLSLGLGHPKKDRETVDELTAEQRGGGASAGCQLGSTPLAPRRDTSVDPCGRQCSLHQHGAIWSLCIAEGCIEVYHSCVKAALSLLATRGWLLWLYISLCFMC